MLPRRAVLALCLLLPVSAFAFSGRPLSGLRFESRADDFQVTSVASDGTDFLLVSWQRDNTVRGQLVKNGVPEPAFYIGDGGSSSVVWTGSVYLVSYRTDSGVYLATISRGGGLIGAPRRILQGSYGITKIVTNGERVLVTAAVSFFVNNNELHGVLLDLGGYPLSGGIVLAYWNGFRSGMYDVAGTGDGFTLLMYGFDATRVVRYNAVGLPVNPEGTLLEPVYGGTTGDYHSFGGVIAGHGDNALVLFSTGYPETPRTLKTAVIGPLGQLVEPAKTVATIDAIRVPLASLDWDGSAFVAALSVDGGVTFDNVKPAMLRIAENGTAIGDLTYLADRDGIARIAYAAAASGNETLIAWYESTSYGSNGSSFVLVPRGSTAASAPTAAGTVANSHMRVVTNALGDLTLAAWTETDSQGWSVRASRVDRNGNFLDGDGIFLAHLRTISPFFTDYGLAVDNDGTNWFVVWSDSYLRGARIDTAGRLLDPTPVELGTGVELAMRWTGTTYLLATGAGDLSVTPVSRDMAVGPTRKLQDLHYGGGTSSDPTIQWRRTSVLCDTQRCLAVSFRHRGFSESSVQPAYVDVVDLVASPLDRNGKPTSEPFTIATNVWDYPLGLATSGSTDVFFYQQYNALYAALLPAGATSPTIVKLEEPSTNGFTAAYDGHDFLLGATDAKGITTWRLSTTGTVSDRHRIDMDALLAPRSPSLTATTSGAPLLAYSASDASIERRLRAYAVFLNELDATSVPAPPSRPRAGRLSGGRIVVRWDAQTTRPFGYSVEVRVPGGGYRQLAVAPGNATEVVVPLAGIDVAAVRLRAWNARGMSEASDEGVIAPGIVRAIRK